MVEFASSGGRPELVSYSSAGVGRGTSSIKELSSNRTLIDAINGLVKKTKPGSIKAFAALPGDAVHSEIIEIPKVKDSELGSAVIWELRRRLPDGARDMIVDWNKVGIDEGSGISKKVKVFASATPKKLVGEYKKLFSRAGLRLSSLEIEPFALARSLVGNDRLPVAVVDMGASTTGISIIKNGIPISNKTLKIGGCDITNVIAESLRVEEDSAEQFKMDLCGIDSDFYAMPDAVKPLIQIIAQKTKNLIDDAEGEGAKIERILITGGSCSIPALHKFFEKSLKSKVFAGNPWARVKHAETVRDTLKELASEFAVSVGLAMKGVT